MACAGLTKSDVKFDTFNKLDEFAWVPLFLQITT